MANLKGLLGSMLATGMAGRSARGPAFAQSSMLPGMAAGMAGGRGGFGQMAGIASLGWLAYKAYQSHVAKDPAAQPQQTQYLNARSAHGDGPSLGDRMAQQLSRGPESGDPTQEPEIGDDKALLLIRAMVAAARADGEIDAEERRRILDSLDRAGAGPEEHRILEHELADPPSLDDIVAAVQDPETAEQVWLAAQASIKVDGPAEKSWLAHLADRLALSADRREALRRIA